MDAYFREVRDELDSFYPLNTSEAEELVEKGDIVFSLVPGVESVDLYDVGEGYVLRFRSEVVDLYGFFEEEYYSEVTGYILE